MDNELYIHSDYTVCTGCCGTLDHIVTFFFKNLSKNKGSVPLSPTRQTTFLRLLEVHSDMFQQMLSSTMNIIMFENCRCQWSMSRPLLGLILLNEEVCTNACVQHHSSDYLLLLLIDVIIGG